MYRPIKLITVLILVAGVFSQAQDSGENSTTALPFDEASVRFEQNATDGDVEVVFEVKAGDDGLMKLDVIGPDGRIVINTTSPDASTLGIRQFRFESPEPTDIPGLQAAYPEGEYKFTGVMNDGSKYESISKLNHKLPGTISFLNPQPESENVNIDGLIISWSPVEDAVSYIIEIDQDELGFNISAKIGGDKSTLIIPDGMLLSGKEYSLAIGSVSEDGNSSFVETSFTTAE